MGEVRRRIIRYFKSYLAEQAAVAEDDIVKELSPSLRKEVGKLVIHQDILNNPLFDGLPINAVARLQTIVKLVNIESGGEVVQAGESGTAMFIVNKGMVRLELESGETRLPPRVLTGGDSFGEEILTGLEEKYLYTVVAIQPASLHV